MGPMRWLKKKGTVKPDLYVTTRTPKAAAKAEKIGDFGIRTLDHRAKNSHDAIKALSHCLFLPLNLKSYWGDCLLSAMLTFCYTGHIVLNEANVPELLHLSNAYGTSLSKHHFLTLVFRHLCGLEGFICTA